MKKLTLTVENDFDFDFVRILLNKLNISFHEEVNTTVENNILEETNEITETEIDKICNESIQESVEVIGDSSNEVNEVLETIPKKKNYNTKDFNFTYSDETIKAVYKTIKVIQRNYFKTGLKKYIIPMVLNDVAEIIGKDISTVSKILDNAKYTIKGDTFFYKDLFSIHDFSTFDGRPVSRFEVLNLIEEYIKNEDKKKPCTDIFLEKELQSLGYNIKRRTVAKYRNDILRIPSTFERKDKF